MALLRLFLGFLTTIVLTAAESHFAGSPSFAIPCAESGGLCPIFCKTGWSGCNCDIPICNPACVGDKVCLSPNNCGCLKNGTGGSTNCPYAQCSGGPDCYPGTCDDTGRNCTCPTQYGFTGFNCLNITATPEIKRCVVEVYDSFNNLLRQANCAVCENRSSVNWINSASIGNIAAAWDAWYQHRPQLPRNPPITYINPAPITIGVTKASAQITFFESGNSTRAYTGNCNQAREQISPPTSVDCLARMNWQTIGFPPTPLHNQEFRVILSAQLGGQKKFNLADAPNQQFVGTPTTRSFAFKFDLKPPAHCLTNRTASDCPYFAIYLDQDIRTDPKIEAKFYNWTDDGSGIDKFNVKIFKMSPSNNLLEQGLDPLPYSEQDINPDRNDYLFTMNQESGVYSIVLTVYDRAGNTAKARKLFIYNKDSQLRIDPNNPVRLMEANPSTNYTWLTSFDNPRDGSNIPLTVTWANHFISNAQFSGDWGFAARPWDPNDGIDDRYGTRYGRRSIDAIQQLRDGISSYAVAYVLDPSGGGRGSSPPTWVILNSISTSYKLPINQGLSDGNTIVIWVDATHVVFGSAIEKLVIGVDRTPPEVKQQSYQLKTRLYGTNTSLIINVVDKESGIASITYRISASGLSLPVAVALPQKRASPNSRATWDLNTPCAVNDTTCYCIPQGDCFN